MRIAVLTDIHGNLTAFEAVLADLEQSSPDLILHGGDLADSGSSPVEIVDRIRDLGWPGVMGNTDEMLVRPESLEAFAGQSKAPATIWSTIREIADATRTILGEERLAWLRKLPRVRTFGLFALVHASPEDCWRAPAADAPDAEIHSIFASLGQPIVIHGHTHRPAIRTMDGVPQMLINAGSVGLPYDGDPRASYLLLDGETPSIRRVQYDIAEEQERLSTCGLPGAAWTSRMLRSASPEMP